MFCSYIFFLLPDCFTYFTRLLLTTRYYLVPVGRYGLRVRIMAIEEDGMMTLRIGLKFSVCFVHIICIYIYMPYATRAAYCCSMQSITFPYIFTYYSTSTYVVLCSP